MVVECERGGGGAGHDRRDEEGRRTEQQNVRNVRTYILDCHCGLVLDKVGVELRSLGKSTTEEIYTECV